MSRIPRILLTGFEPFGEDQTNPSWEAVRRLDAQVIGGHRIQARCLPVTFEGALPALQGALDQVCPRLVICTGLAASRARISLERVAINVCDARIPDNAGAQPVDRPVIAGGPAAYFTTLPIKAMHAALARADIPSEISQTAGTYVCNQVFYGVLHALRRRKVRAGFIHVPHPPGPQALCAGTAGMPLEQVIQALRFCIETALATTVDLTLHAGAED